MRSYNDGLFDVETLLLNRHRELRALARSEESRGNMILKNQYTGTAGELMATINAINAMKQK